MSASLIPSFVDYARRQGAAGVALLEKWHDQAVADLAEGGGLAITSLSYPGASTAAQVAIPAADLLTALLAALKELRGQRPEPLGSHINFRAMPYSV